MIEHLAAIAAAEIGVKEVGANSGPRIREYQKATWLAPGQWPWCAAFVAWCLREWLKVDGARLALDLKPGAPAEGWRCRDARAFGWEAWATKHGMQVLPESAPMLPGDIVTFDFSHIGIVVADRGAVIETIEGNTNGDGERDGDGVYRKQRPRALVRRVIRIQP